MKRKSKFTILLLVFLLPLSLFAQQEEVQVRGNVTEAETGDALPGVTIVVENSGRGVITDVDGTFEIRVTPSDKLTFSFIGMTSQTVEVGSKRYFEIAMNPVTQELEEFTVVAFGKQKKESVIGSITTINPSELKVPSSNLTTALAGRMAGVISYQRSGEPGQDNADFLSEA
jgi:hypothetical protein